MNLPNSIEDFEQWAQGDFYVVNREENTIELPHRGEAILLKDGIWYVVQAQGYLYRIEGKDQLRAWLDLRTLDDLGALYIIDTYPEYIPLVLAYMCDVEVSVEDPRVVTRLEEFLQGDDGFKFALASQVLLVCARGWKLGFDIDAKFQPLFSRMLKNFM